MYDSFAQITGIDYYFEICSPIAHIVLNRRTLFDFIAPIRYVSLRYSGSIINIEQSF